MSEIVHHVDATFGGASVRFQLNRDHDTVTKLEDAVGSVSACWGRFNSGDWTMRDVRTILALAHPAPKQGRGMFVHLRPPLEIERAMAHLRGERYQRKAPPPEPRGVDPATIDAVTASRPLATYAPLAGAILAAAFIGLPKNAAVFDERAPLIAGPPAEEAAA